MCEAQGAETELCAMIQALRQGATGYNPFIVIIVTAWENNNALVGRVINSGADDLLLRPFSTAVLGNRIRTHVERRKGFVITSEYVGPDRRNDPARAVECRFVRAAQFAEDESAGAADRRRWPTSASTRSSRPRARF